MLSQLLRKQAQAHPSRPFLVDAQRRITFAETLSTALATAAFFQALDIKRVYFHASDCATIIIGSLAAGLAGADTIIIDHDLSDEDVEGLRSQNGTGLLFRDTGFGGDIADDNSTLHLSWILTPPLLRGDAPDISHAGAGQISIFAGRSETIRGATTDTWHHILEQAESLSPVLAIPTTSLLAYPLARYDSLQAVLHTLMEGGTIVLPLSHTFGDCLDAALRHHVDAIVAPLAFWCHLVDHVNVDGETMLELRQITLVDKACSRELLAKINMRFPHATLQQLTIERNNGG